MAKADLYSFFQLICELARTSVIWGKGKEIGGKDLDFSRIKSTNYSKIGLYIYNIYHSISN